MNWRGLSLARKGVHTGPDRCHPGAGEHFPREVPMPLTVFSIVLPIVASPSVFLLAFFLPVPWEPTLDPKWSWIVSTTGATIALVAAAGFLWPILDHHWFHLTGASVIGLAIFLAGWDLQLALWGLSHGVRWVLFVVSFALLVLGAWQAIRIKTEDLPRERARGRTEGRVEGRRKGYDSGHTQGRNDGYVEGYAQGRAQGYGEGAVQGREEGRNQGYAQGHAKGRAQGYGEGAQRGRDEGYAEGYVKGRADGADDIQHARASSPFNPWRVLGLQPDSDQAAIRTAFREQSEKNHPDKVAHLSETLQAAADRQMKEINRAYAMLRKR